MKNVRRIVVSAIAIAALLALAGPAAAAQQAGAGQESAAGRHEVSTGSVIFFHPDGTGANHWSAARMYFKGPDGHLNWDLLPHLALYRGHMLNNLIATSNGGATTHAFGYRVDSLGSFGKNGEGAHSVFINSLSGYPGSIMREAANTGIPVGLVNDGHIGEPGTGCFLAEVGNRRNWQEIIRQMIQGRPGFKDTPPWVIMGGGEADTRPAGTPLVHRNHNQERGRPLNEAVSLRTDDLDLEAEWNARGSGDLGNDPAAFDDWIVVKTRAEFEKLRTALAADPTYAPRVLGLFAYHDTFNDRNEEDLIARGKITSDPVNFVGPLQDPTPRTPGFRPKASRLILWGDVPGQPGFNPPAFKEMVAVALTILERAAARQKDPGKRRFFLVAEQEANDNFGNNNNAIGLLHALHDTDEAIGAARALLDRSPHTLILTAADSDAGGLQVTAPYRSAVVSDAGDINTSSFRFGFHANPAAGSPDLPNIPDGLEGRGRNAAAPGGAKMFLAEPDRLGQTMQFGIGWAGTGDYAGAVLSRAAGVNAGLLHTIFASRFDNIDVYRLMYATLFGTLFPTPDDPTAPARTPLAAGAAPRFPSPLHRPPTSPPSSDALPSVR
jgi:alkaline phosphatase